MILKEDLNYYFYFNSYQFWNDFVDMGYAKKNPKTNVYSENNLAVLQIGFLLND